MFPRIRMIRAACAAALFTFNLSVQAYDDHPEPPDGQRGQAPAPPQEAVDACAGLSEGASCSFTGRRNDTINGQCFIPPTGDLACRPDHMGEPPNGQRPPTRN